ncbi:MAG: transglutaminase domain-containing protein [Cellulosilyticum sp.]|nr:transglutaminase domain-containing protein [Cellulosilyticum sp.]
MIKLDGIKKQHSDLISSFLFSLGIIMLVAHGLDLKISIVLLILGSAVVHLGIFIIDSYRKTLWLYIGMGMIAIGSYLVYRHYQETIHLIVGETYHYFFYKNMSDASDEKVYSLIVSGLMILSIGTISYIGNKFMGIKLFFTCMIVGTLVYLGIKEHDASKLGVLLLIVYGIVVMIEKQHMKQYGQVGQESWKVTTSILPICILIGIVAVGLPAKEKPISWQWVYKCYAKITDSISDMKAEIGFRFGGVSDTFGLNFYGVEEGSSLGGNLGEGDAIMLQVKPNSKTHHPIYLAGNYKDTYTGESWICTYDEESSIEEYKLRTYEMLYGLTQGNMGMETGELLKENKLEVSYEQIRTRTLFIPSFVQEIETLSEKRMPIYKSSSITFPKRQKQNQSYHLTFIEMNTEGETFKNHLRRLEDFSYTEAKAINEAAFLECFKGKINKAFLEEVLEEETLLYQLEEHSQMIQDIYTTLPETLPERIKKLTLEITEGCETTYDQLKAIEQYLKGYTYTRMPGEVPKQEDFVDYFLFESRQGYCTYFASSMAVMARTIGIPTRYVEGFIVDYSEIEKGLILNVPTDKAHAWVEAYFEGIGWIQFEPSAGYEVVSYYPWQVESSEEQEDIEEQVLAPEEVDTVGDLEIITFEQVEEQAKEDKKYDTFLFKGIGILVILLMSFIVIRLALYNSKLKKADNLTQYKMYFKENMYLLGRMGYSLKAGETLLQFQNRMTKVQKDQDTLIGEMLSTYSKVRYSQKEITRTQKEEMKQFYKKMCQLEYIKCGKLKGLWWQLIYKIYIYSKN